MVSYMGQVYSHVPDQRDFNPWVSQSNWDFSEQSIYPHCCSLVFKSYLTLCVRVCMCVCVCERERERERPRERERETERERDRERERETKRDTPRTVAVRLLCTSDFPGKNTRTGCHFLLQGILSTQGSKPSVSCLAGGFFTTEPPGEAQSIHIVNG